VDGMIQMGDFICMQARFWLFFILKYYLHGLVYVFQRKSLIKTVKTKINKLKMCHKIAKMGIFLISIIFLKTEVYFKNSYLEENDRKLFSLQKHLRFRFL
jgi:hypothetical protein